MKRRLFTALISSALVCGALAPTALAQAVIEDDDDAVQYVDCSQVQNVFANQGQYANANAAADDDSEAVAEVAQELNISQNQVNACLGNVGPTPEQTEPTEPTDDNDGNGGNNGDPAANNGDELADGEDAVEQGTFSAGELPETGGANVGGIVLASGCALLGAGLLVNRILR